MPCARCPPGETFKEGCNDFGVASETSVMAGSEAERSGMPGNGSQARADCKVRSGAHAGHATSAAALAAAPAESGAKPVQCFFTSQQVVIAG